MHELSIAQSICEIALESIDQYPDHTINKIGLRIGAISDVDPDALQFGFDIIKLEYELTDCDLSIELVPARGCCRNCKAAFTVRDFVFICPDCESMKVDLLSGQEMEISHLVLNSADEETAKSISGRMTNAAS